MDDIEVGNQDDRDPWAERRVLVTGATGMVGSSLCKALIRRGTYAVALICDWDPQSDLIRSGAVNEMNVISGRLEEFDVLERAINLHEIDTVIHLGAQTVVGTADRSPRQTFETNVAGTWNLLEACRIHHELVRRVVVASSDKAYGTQPVLPYTEDMSLDGRAPYEVSKSCTDLVARSYALTYSLPITIARCGNIFGSGDLNWSNLVPGTVRSLLLGQQPHLRSDGKAVRDYIHVDDIVSAYLLLADHSDDPGLCGEAFNFSDESPLSVMEMYRAICDALGGWVEPHIANTASGEIPDQWLNASKARRVLDWRVESSLSEGLAKTVAWYREYLG